MELEQRFEFLDALPELLFSTVVTTRHGVLAERVTGILQWRAALLLGGLPAPADLAWPAADISHVLLPRLEAMEIPALCANQAALTDHLLETLCVAVDSIDEWREQGMTGLFDDILEQHHRRRERLSESASGRDSSLAPRRSPESRGDVPRQPADGAATAARAQPSAATNNADGDLRRRPETAPSTSTAAQPAAQAGESRGTSRPGVDGNAEISASLQQQWQQLIDNWQHANQLVSGMGTRLGRGWDLSQGRPRLQGWRDFAALRRWIKTHPALIALVNSLGRERASLADNVEQPEAIYSTDTGCVSRCAVPRPISSDAPDDTRGITRSDEIARMLPQEAAFLGHPLLKGLWHARRAEQALLTYRVQGVMSAHRMAPAANRPRPRSAHSRPRQGSGPVMVCVDTSASMHGEPEIVAKAVCLEVLRLANQQQRNCLLFAFSGPGQILQISLAFSPSGLRELMTLLRQSFAGGTDIAGPLRLALRRNREQRWQQADLLLISDGRFPVSNQLAAEVNQARRATGLRIQGISIGRWSGRSLKLLCDSVLQFDPAISSRLDLD